MRKQILSSILLSVGATIASHLGGWWVASLMCVILIIVLIVQDIAIDVQQKLIDTYREAHVSLCATCDGYQKLIQQYREMWAEIVGETR